MTSAGGAESQRGADLPTSMGRFLGRVARLSWLRPRAPHEPQDLRPVAVLIGELGRLIAERADDRDGLQRDPAFWSLVHALYAKRPRVVLATAGRRRASDADAAEGAIGEEGEEAELVEADVEGASSADEVASAIGTEYEPGDDEGTSSDEDEASGEVSADEVASAIGTEYEPGDDEETSSGEDEASGEAERAQEER